MAQKTQDREEEDKKMDESDSVAFAELIEYIEGCSKSGSRVFKLADFSILHDQRLDETLEIKKAIDIRPDLRMR